MIEAARVTRVEALEPHWLRVWFADGSIHEVDVGVQLRRGGVFEAVYTDPEVFSQVGVEPRFGAVEWPGPVDLDPDVLQGLAEPASGEGYPRRVIRPAGQPA